jgi:hypothetical protein
MWVVIAATVVIVIASVVIVVVSVSGGDDTTDAAPTSSSSSTTKASVPKTSRTATTKAAPPPPPVTPIAPDALMGVLLTPPEVAGVFQVPAAIETQSGTDMIGGDSPIPLQCRSVWAPAHKETYDPTGSTGVARKTVRQDPADDKGVVEAVVTYPDAAAAKAAVDAVVAAWKQCQYFEFTESFGGSSINWKTGVVGDTDGVFTLLVFSRSQLDSPQTSTDPNCQRAITADRNVVVDVLACSPKLGSEGYSMARDIVQKIDVAP